MQIKVHEFIRRDYLSKGSSRRLRRRLISRCV